MSAFGETLIIDTWIGTKDTERQAPVDGDTLFQIFSSSKAQITVLAHIFAERGLLDLDAPIARVCTEEVPIPYPKHLEQAALPQPEKIVAAVQNLFGDRR